MQLSDPHRRREASSTAQAVDASRIRRRSEVRRRPTGYHFVEGWHELEEDAVGSWALANSLVPRGLTFSVSRIGRTCPPYIDFILKA